MSVGCCIAEGVIVSLYCSLLAWHLYTSFPLLASNQIPQTQNILFTNKSTAYFGQQVICKNVIHMVRIISTRKQITSAPYKCLWISLRFPRQVAQTTPDEDGAMSYCLQASKQARPRMQGSRVFTCLLHNCQHICMYDCSYIWQNMLLLGTI